jgi:glutathione synthase/RimK-type ligase-like ATP-grasp enzyme
MNAFLLHARKSGPSGREIAGGLGIGCGRSDSHPNVRPNYLIRWGCTAQSVEPVLRTINTPEAIARAVDKAYALSTWRSEGIPVPRWSHNWLELEFPIIGRKTMCGKGGKGIVLFLQPYDVVCNTEPIEAYVQYIPKAREFRVHVAFDNVIKVSEKKYDPTKGKKYNPIVWNHRNGFVFRRKVRNYDPEFNYIACDAVRSLGLDFGAVDLLMGRDGFPYVLEVNTAPGTTSPTTLNAYVQAIRPVIGQ